MSHMAMGKSSPLKNCNVKNKVRIKQIKSSANLNMKMTYLLCVIDNNFAIFHFYETENTDEILQYITSKLFNNVSIFASFFFIYVLVRASSSKNPANLVLLASTTCKFYQYFFLIFPFTPHIKS